jgi:hypothetical protein
MANINDVGQRDQRPEEVKEAYDPNNDPTRSAEQDQAEDDAVDEDDLDEVDEDEDDEETDDIDD